MSNAVAIDTSALSALDRFDGEFDFLPLAAALRYGDVPQYPTSANFHDFVSTKCHDKCPEACWHLEAIRWRLHNQGKPLNIKAIALATAASILSMQGRS